MSRAHRFLLGLFGLFTIVLIAAPARASSITLALKGGFSAATLHGHLPIDDLVTRGMRLGGGGGIAATFPVGGPVAIQPELLYVMRGTTLGEIDITDYAGNPVGTSRVVQANDYLELPVLARIALPMRGTMSPPYLIVGPTFSYLLSQRIVVIGPQPHLGFGEVDLVERGDVGLALGAGAELGSGRARMSVETRYTLGLTRATRESYGDGRNGTLMAMVGLAIRP